MLWHRAAPRAWRIVSRRSHQNESIWPEHALIAHPPVHHPQAPGHDFHDVEGEIRVLLGQVHESPSADGGQDDVRFGDHRGAALGRVDQRQVIGELLFDKGDINWADWKK